ncbi:hypothetical protein VP01_1910g6 [Puccinia sorghi]|uniref:Uncharacterized protein n=1 Tax=Puccinia sorghi TaxID=27349 RepID=A0A0L6VCN5_9BASI|nr:hypothetical protein VP01_1910g6 [Puccinia sorghi]
MSLTSKNPPNNGFSTPSPRCGNNQIPTRTGHQIFQSSQQNRPTAISYAHSTSKLPAALASTNFQKINMHVLCLPTECLVFTCEQLSFIFFMTCDHTTDESGMCLEALAVSCERSKNLYNDIPSISTSVLVVHLVQEETLDKFDF